MSMLINAARFSGATDPFFSSTVLLLSFDGANGATSVTDESFALHGASFRFGSAQVTTSQFKYGATAGQFTAGVSDVFYWVDHADFEFGSGQFTIECWYRPASVVGDHRIIAKFAAAGTFSWMLWQNGANLVWLTSTTGLAFNLDISVLHGFSANTWYHLAISFDGAKIRMFKDGVMIGSTTTTRNLFNGTAPISIGNDGGFASAINGYMDEVRVTKGVGRYASDSSFTPPTEAFPRA